MNLTNPNLRELRCYACGLLMGQVTNSADASTWCNEGCASTPISRIRSNQGRDELIVALFLEGRTAVQISNELDLTRQNVQQILDKRGISPYAVAS